MIGKVWLVGAGPGDPDLITRKGLRLIRSADVIVFDRLIPLELLAEARPDATLINVGKAPARQRLNQARINETIVAHALLGEQVLRLKGGDPAALRSRRRGSTGLSRGWRSLRDCARHFQRVCRAGLCRNSVDAAPGQQQRHHTHRS